MASGNHQNPNAPPSIPLRDLSQLPDEEDGILAEGIEQRRSVRNLLGSNLRNRRYSRIEGSPTPAGGSSRVPHPYVTDTSDGDVSPIEDEGDGADDFDRGGFQEALGFSGLTFQGEDTATHAAPAPSRPGLFPTHSSFRDQPSSFSHPMESYADESESYFQTDNSDRTPLSSPRYLSPFGDSRQPQSHGQRHDRESFQSVRFSTSDGSSRPARLGDDLPSVEAGRDGQGRLDRSGSRRQRSLSPSSASPLSRAGSMVRKMSQRVVNLSNEPELVEQSIRRKSSLKQARLDEPPLLPAIEGYASDRPPTMIRPVEKSPHLDRVGQPSKQWQRQINPLKGNSVGVFPPKNRLRMQLCDLLVHPATEPTILVLIVIQTILLAIDSAPSVYNDPRSQRWGKVWIDYALLALFSIYTAEIVARVIVSGFIMNPEEYSSTDRSQGYWNAFLENFQNLFAPHRPQALTRRVTGNSHSKDSTPQSILRSFTGMQAHIDTPGHTVQQQRIRLARRAFMRHSFNRLDFLAVVSFWISFALGIFGLEYRDHLYVFRMLSCLRILRLLGLTSGTSVILRSLKKAAPLLANVAFLISFFWLLFAIVGIQSFKASLRRTCIWVDPEGIQANETIHMQFCGGHLNNVTGAQEPWINSHGVPGAPAHKGYLCPRNSFCVEAQNPYNGTVSFDNVLQSLELVFVIMSSNTFSDLLYYLTDTDYLAAALFFAAGIFIMSLWLANLLVAVITSSFQVIREESKTSAFTADQVTEEAEEEGPATKKGALAKWYEKTSWIWILVILYGLIVQAIRSAHMGLRRRSFIDVSETAVTLVLLAEIVIRFAADWRGFFKSKYNCVDLALAVITTIIQIPPIRNSGQPYAWLTFFQIIRIYRVVLAVSLTRDLIMVVLGNVTGLLNLMVFVFLFTFLTAIFAVQIFRGELLPTDNQGNTIHITFFTIYNAFIGMYQVFSSENWTAILYDVTAFEVGYSTAWIGAAFLILWFILANFIILNMFIAVIQENFDVTEDEKRLQQVKSFLQRKEVGGNSHGNLSLSSIFKLSSKSHHQDPLNYGQASLETLLKEAVVKDFLDDQEQLLPKTTNETSGAATFRPEVRAGFVTVIWEKCIGLFSDGDVNPFYSRLQFSRAYDDLDPRTLAKEVLSARERRKAAQREYLLRYPNYNVSLYIFKPGNPIRKVCQYIVGPGRGEVRVGGPEPIKAMWYSFSAFIYANIVAMVLLACITTPLYQKEYFQTHQFSIDNWFVYTDMAFAVLFTFEALIKVIADGFFWTPNAYFRGTWGLIDGVVLITLWVNVAAQFYNDGAVSRAVGAFKALRALRLLNVSDSARNTFHSVIVIGGWKIISAAFVSMSLLIPFAIYGLNIFNGQMEICNDTMDSITNLTDCVGEFLSSPTAWNVLAPRAVSNPYYDFDNFGSSLFILFQIVSQEGWTDVMWSAESIVARGLQPQPFSSQGNALFFVAFNILGSVFVLTLFVSVFMRNYTEQTGVAYLTADQRSWMELRKLLRQISPSKRPWNKPNQKWKNWSFHQATQKHGRWQRFITLVLSLHLVLLVLEFYPSIDWWDETRDFIFLAFTVLYIFNIVIRIVGLSWHRFRKSSWDLFSLAAVSGTFITTVLLLSNFNERVYVQLHKLFLVAIALLLIPRNNQLDQLFKTAAASLSAIGNLLATWCVLLLVFAIAFTQAFGLTRFGTNETGNINFRTVPKALILLFRMICGEGWNQIMEDFATIQPPQCVTSDDFFQSDCGSPTWARALFISWNILSMYIFVSLFVSLIFESFSYVYQRSSGLSVVSREEIRKFKHAWSVFDPDGTGFITKDKFPKLLGELTGLFEMRVYDGDHSVGAILEDCSETLAVGTRQSYTVEGGGAANYLRVQSKRGEWVQIDLAKMARRLSTIPVHEIRRRRARMNIFYEEVLVSADPDRGIPFTTALMILAHYNVISDNKSLRLEEFLHRRARLQLVDESVRRNIVIGFFDTMHWSRKFRNVVAARRSARLASPPALAVPEIYVDDEDDELSPGGHRDPFASPPQSTSPSPGHSRSGTPSNAGDGLGDRTPQLSPNRAGFQASPGHRHGHDATGWGSIGGNLVSPQNAASNPPAGDGEHSRQGSSVSAQDVLEVLDNSAWGESIRRSFTLRRPSS